MRFKNFRTNRVLSWKTLEMCTIHQKNIEYIIEIVITTFTREFGLGVLINRTELNASFNRGHETITE